MSINVYGNGNVVAGRDVNIASEVVSIEDIPPQFQSDFNELVNYIRLNNVETNQKKIKIEYFLSELSKSGFSSLVASLAKYLFGLILV
jgi:hypothetical protein